MSRRFALLVLPFFAFIAGSADMDINGFGLTPRQFGCFQHRFRSHRA